LAAGAYTLVAQPTPGNRNEGVQILSPLDNPVAVGNNAIQLTNPLQVAQVYSNLWTPSGVTKNTYVQAFAVALGVYADTTSLGGQSLINNGLAPTYGFVVTSGGVVAALSTSAITARPSPWPTAPRSRSLRS
jgi:hypothetical protein